MSVGQLVVLELAVLDVLAGPVAEMAALLQLLMGLSGPGGLKKECILFSYYYRYLAEESLFSSPIFSS